MPWLFFFFRDTRPFPSDVIVPFPCRQVEPRAALSVSTRRRQMAGRHAAKSVEVKFVLAVKNTEWLEDALNQRDSPNPRNT